MPLPLTVSCFSKIQVGFTFLVPAHLGSFGQWAVKRMCAYMCVCSCGRRQSAGIYLAAVHDDDDDSASFSGRATVDSCLHGDTTLNSFLRRCDKLGYMEKHYVDISTMFQEADDALFCTIMSNRSQSCFYTCLSERSEIAYSLRTRNHNKFLIPKNSDLGDRHFIIRSLYKNLYWCDLTNQTYMSIHLSP